MLTRSPTAIIITASLAGLLFGFDTAVISGVTQSLREVFGLSPERLGLAVSAALWGTLLGALALGRPGDVFGARAGLKFVAALYLVSALGAALAWNLASFVAFRCLTGVAIGGSSILAPVYIAEVAPAERRGARVGLFQFNIVAGILIAYVSNFLIDRLIGGGDAWRYKLAVPAAPALVFVVLLQWVPHSPRWLIAKGRLSEAARTLSGPGVSHPEQALAQIAAQAADRARAETARLSWRQHHKPIVLAIAIAMFNQLSGINAILYYLGDIFSAAGFNTVSANVQSIAIGLTNLVATLVAMACIDRAGRRRLLLLGSVGTALAQGAVAIVMALGTTRVLLLPLLIVFIASFAGSQGAVIWVYLSEIFPTPVRARGQGLGSAVHWAMNASIAALFPAIAARSVALPFAFFSLMMLLQFVFVWRYLPETRGIALEGIQRALQEPASAP